MFRVFFLYGLSMINDPKIRKFVDFYLSELLTHAKSMIETRFTPMEYNLVKKIIVFITQSKDHYAQIGSLESASQLSAFTGFLQKIVLKVQQPDFKKSQMISAIETDSERLSQIWAQIIKNRENLPALRSELKPIGIEIDVDSLLKEPVKAGTTAEPKSEKTAIPPTPIKQVAVEKKTEPPANKVKKEEEPRILSASEFKKVDDMIGFLSKRRRKTVHEEQALEQKTEATIRPASDHEGVASDREDFFTEFRAEFKRLDAAVTQLRTNLGRTRYFIELADSFGEFKRIGKIFELPRFSRLMNSIEKTLIDFADNVGEKKARMNDASFGVLQQVAVLFKETEMQGRFPLTSSFLDDIASLIDQFTASAGTEATPPAEDKIETAKMAEVDAEIKRVAESADEAVVRLSTTDMDAEDLKVFLDEAQYSFETIRSAVQKLKASGSDHASIKNIQQSFRSLYTGSKLLRFTVFTAHFDLVLKQLKTCLDSQNAIAPELLHLIEETVGGAAELVSGSEISETAWSVLKTKLEEFGTHKELPTGETPAEFTPAAKALPKAAQVQESKGTSKEVSTVVSNESWISGLQRTLEEHPYVVKASEEEKQEEPQKKIPEKAVQKEVVKEETEKPVPVPVVKEKPAEKTPAVEKSDEDESELVTIPTDLVNMMAKGDVDLSGLELKSFAEKLNIEPRNIVGSKIKAHKKVSKKADATSTAEKPAKTMSPGQTTTAKTTEPKEGQFLIGESSFESIDAEILDIFNQEAEGYFRILEKSLSKLDGQIKDETAIKDIERVSHSLKSSSRMLGLSKVSGLAAVIELIAERCNEKELEMTEELKNVMRSTVQSILQLIERKSSDIAPIISYLTRLESTLSAPNIFIGNIPGASAFVSSGAVDVKKIPEPVAAASSVEAPAVKEEKPEPVKTERVKTEPKAEPKKDYFTKIGVDEEIVEIFKEEAATYFKLIANSLNHLRDNPGHETAMRDIEKSAHSLRSSAKMLGFQKIGDVVKPVETVAERINAGGLIPDTRILDTLEEALKALKSLGDGIDTDIMDLIQRLAACEKQPLELKSAPAAVRQTVKEKAAPKKAKSSRKSSKSQAEYFSDISFTSDPILKQLNKGTAELLEEMSQTSTH